MGEERFGKLRGDPGRLFARLRSEPGDRDGLETTQRVSAAEPAATINLSETPLGMLWLAGGDCFGAAPPRLAGGGELVVAGGVRLAVDHAPRGE